MYELAGQFTHVLGYSSLTGHMCDSERKSNNERYSKFENFDFRYFDKRLSIVQIFYFRYFDKHLHIHIYMYIYRCADIVHGPLRLRNHACVAFVEMERGKSCARTFHMNECICRHCTCSSASTKSYMCRPCGNEEGQKMCTNISHGRVRLPIHVPCPLCGFQGSQGGAMHCA